MRLMVVLLVATLGMGTAHAQYGGGSGSGNDSAEATVLVVDAGQSTVTVNQTSRLANGNSTATIIVTARDAGGSVISGATVSLAQDGSSVISDGGITGTDGAFVFTVTNTNVEQVSYTATAGGTAITPTVAVDFVAPTVDAGQSTVSVNRTTRLANGDSTAIIIVTARDADGLAVSGASVSLAQDGNSAISNAGFTGADGAFVFEVSNTLVEQVTYTATAGGTVITPTVAVDFVAPAVDAGNSLVSVDQGTRMANGNSTATITVTAKDADGVPVKDSAASLSQNGNSVVSIGGDTNTNGVFVFTVTNTTVENVTYTATAGGTIITQTVAVNFVAPTVDADNSSVSATPTTVTANGNSVATITVTAVDADGVAVSGATVSIAQDGNSVVSTSGVTGTDGTFAFAVTNANVETVTYTATAGGIEVTQTAAVDFVLKPDLIFKDRFQQ